jgi:hypothetical protein
MGLYSSNCTWFWGNFSYVAPLEWKIEISPKSIQTIRLSIPITMRSLKWIGKGVLNLQCDIWKIASKSRTIWWIKSHNWNENSIVLWSVYFLVKFQFFIPELWDFIHQIVCDFKAIFHMSHCKLRTPLPIHFKLRTVIGIDSFMICILGEISIFHSRFMGLYSS